MSLTFGFSLQREVYVEELAGTARIWKHEQSGSELLSISNKDENKVFGVTFRTPATDSTGVAHILEHSVLCGSEKYPSKEPFVELLKSSLQTFLNAFTYPDKTCYPVASCNLQDFRSLTDVYLDAVFFPRITKEIFEQEGWHLEAEDLDGPIARKGVVYNEMKGAFSSPETVLSSQALHGLFPDVSYVKESGGDPEAIPELSYENFLRFHQDFYHPSNAKFFFWGDDKEEDRLAQLDAVLSRFHKKSIDSHISKQKKWKKARKMTIPFAASSNDKGFITVNWLLSDIEDVQLGLAFRMLEHILLGMPASPLRRALIESSLGEDLAGSGLETDLRQLTFDIGLKGIDTSKASELETIIENTLKELSEKGIPQQYVEAAVNSVEFALRENDTGRFPVGLAIMLRSLTTWLHDIDPLAPLEYTKHLDAIKAELKQNTGYFEKLIATYFLQNPHRLTVTLQPDMQLAEQKKEKEERELAKIAKKMSKKEREEVYANTVKLRKLQEQPDSPEALAAIPRLHPQDLAKTNTSIPTESDPKNLLDYHALDTGGIAYLELYFDLSSVPQKLFYLLPLWGRMLTEAGTQKTAFAELNLKIAQHTGGVDTDLLVVSNGQTRDPVARLVLSGKATPDKFKKLFLIVEELLNTPNFDQKDRFLAISLEDKARLERNLIPSGHSVVATRLRAHFSPAASLIEESNGIRALFSLRALIEKIQNNWEEVHADLLSLTKAIINAKGVYANISCLEQHKAELSALCKALIEKLPSHETQKQVWEKISFAPAEAFILPAQVNYVGKAINLFDQGYEWNGSVMVIMKFLRTGYLWDKIRVLGGAYGCMCSMDRMTGTFFAASYRDPNVESTLATYDTVANYLKNCSMDKQTIENSIVGAIGELDSYLLPSAKGSAAFIRKLCADTEERRQTLRDEIFSTSLQHIRSFGEALESLSSHGKICLLGGDSVAKVAKSKEIDSIKIM